MDTELQHVQWTPGNGLLIVHNNDIYHKASVDSDHVRVTSDGVSGVVFNGLSDWIYRGTVTFLSRTSDHQLPCHQLTLYLYFAF